MENAVLELGPEEMRINAIRPGGVVTPGIQQGAIERQRQNPNADPRLTVGAFMEQTPLLRRRERMATPRDIGKAAAFLAWHDFISGAVLAVDGGWQHHNPFPGE